MVEFRLPDLAEGTTEAELIRWLVRPGDRVALDQSLAEVQTDKVLVTLPAPVAGRVVSLAAREGQMVPVGSLLLTIEETEQASVADTGVPDGAEHHVARPVARPVPATGSERAMAASPNRADEAVATRPGGRAESAAETAPAAGAPAIGDRPGEIAGEHTSARRVLATPAVRRLAQELGVTLAEVQGSGLGGRVLAEDVRAAAAWSTRQTEPAPGPERDATMTQQAQQAGGGDGGVPQRAQAQERQELAGPGGTPSVPDAVQAAVAAVAAGASEPLEERLPLMGLRRRIAENMMLSVRSIPQITSMIEVEATGLVELRRSLLPAAEARGVPLTYLPLIIKALTQALRGFRLINAAIDEASQEIVIKRQYHIGVATATPDGLLVPVLRHADQLTVLEMATELVRLAEGARSRTLTAEELRGSTFTVSNFGSIGGFFATPLINPGEAGILGVGRIAERPWVVEGRVEARPVLPLSFTADHRLIDGDLATNFLNRLVGLLEHPQLLLLELR